jgi:prophage DNA circulation protein
MADWKATLLPASYRGVPFHVETYGGEHGRRWADHEYPGRDVPYAEDLGRAQRVYRFTGYLIGDNYAAVRTLLVAACELPGLGPLIHPTLGPLLVVCRKIEHTEERTRGRYVSLSLEFAEAGKLAQPAGLTIPVSDLVTAAFALGTVLGNNFLGGHSTAGGGPWLTAAAQAQTVQLGVDLQQARLPAPGVDQAALDGAIKTLVEDSASLALDTVALGAAIEAAFAAFTDAGDAMPVVTSMIQYATPSATLAELQGFLDSGVVTNPGVTPVIDQRRLNIIAFHTYTRGLALRETGYAITGVPLANYDQALALLDQVAAAFIALETVVANEGADDVYAALADLRAKITQLILSRAADLTPLVNYRVQSATPANSLTLAWTMYQDAGRDLEVVDEVDARNPAFLPFTGRVLVA